VSQVVRVGLISDTHGAVPRAVFSALAGVTRILHAGDVGSSRVLDELGRIAPVAAVRGNTDLESDLALSLPSFLVADVAGVRFAVTHIKGRALTLDDARRNGCDVYVFGHTHIPDLTGDDGLWIVNPGSPSRTRAGHGHSVGVVEVSEGTVTSVEVLEIG